MGGKRISVILAGFCLAATAQPFSANAASGVHPHAVAHAATSYIDYLEGNGKYLVYGTRPDGERAGVMHVMSPDGTVRELGAWPVDSQGNLDFIFSLVGSTLTTEAVGVAYEWWDLADETSGTFPLKATDDWYGSVPGGVLFWRQGDYYTMSTDSNDITALDPALDEVRAGPAGYVGLDNDLGGPVYQSWDGGARVRLKFPTVDDTSESNCFQVTQYYAECIFSRNDGYDSVPGTYVAPLNGSAAIKFKPRPIPHLVALLKRLVWRPSSTSPIKFRAANGTITQSTAAGRIVGDAFLKVVLIRGAASVDGSGGQQLVGLSSASSKPVVLAHT